MPRLKKYYIPIAFVSGWWFSLASLGLKRDIIGKEEWLRLMEEHWEPASITVPLELGVMVASLYLTIIIGAANNKS